MRYHQRKQKEASAPRDMELMDEVAQLRQKLSEARQENRALTREKKKWQCGLDDGNIVLSSSNHGMVSVGLSCGTRGDPG